MSRTARVKTWGLLFPFLVTASLVGCGTNEHSPTEAIVEQEPFVIGQIYHDPWRGMDFERIEVYGSSVIPLVTMNNDTLSLQVGQFYPLTYMGYFPLTDGEEYRLRLEFGSESAAASVHLPGEFSFVQPDSSETLSFAEDLLIRWTRSPGASWYSLDLSVSYSYIDTASNWQYLQVRIDTTAVDTEFTVSHDLMFPDSAAIDSIGSGIGVIYAGANDGPRMVAGSQGNITGAGRGFFWGGPYLPGGRAFVIGNRPSDSCPPKIELARRQLWEERLNLLRRCDPQFRKVFK